MFFGSLVDLERRLFDRFHLVGRDGLDKCRRVPAPLLSRRNIRIGGDHRARFEDDVRFDDGALQDGALFSNHHQIIDPAGFQHAAGADGHVVANVRDGRESRGKGRVLFQSGHDGALSDARCEPDCDGVGGIGTDYGAVPDTGLIPIRDFTNHRCGGRDEGIVCDKGGLAEERHLWTVPRNNLFKSK